MPRHPDSERSASTIGEHLRTWRLLLGLSARQVCERAGVSPSTLSRLERGDGNVNFTTVLEVARSLGLLRSIEEALNPWETDLGRARASVNLPKRIRR